MDFGAAVKACLGKYGTFEGRARRSELWFFALFQFLVGVGAQIVDGIVFGRHTGAVSGLLMLALLVPNIAVACRRLHDLDKSGWRQLLVLIPIIGGIVLLVWYCTRGTPGDNRFGLDPLASADNSQHSVGI